MRVQTMTRFAWWFIAFQIGPPVVLALALRDGSAAPVIATCAWISIGSFAATLFARIAWQRKTDELLSKRPTLAAQPALPPVESDPQLEEYHSVLNSQEQLILSALDSGDVDAARAMIVAHFEEDRDLLDDLAMTDDRELES